MKKLILILLFIPLVSFGQKSNDADALKLCVALQSSSFTTDAEAEDAVNKILSVIGTSQKPILQACNNINNAVAAVYKGQRYILYDRDFMSSLTAGSNKYWSNMFILAHEMGHHLNGHSLDIILYLEDIIDPKSLEERRKQELEADEFAGFVLAKLGATLKETSLVMNNIPSISNENTSTHPVKDKRIASVRKGFKKGEISDSSEIEAVVYTSPEKLETATDYLKRGLYNQELFKNYAAISDYTKAIEIDPDFTEAYLKRASLKYDLEDLNGALSDYDKAIESKFVWYLFWIDYVDSKMYYDRGLVKHMLLDYEAAIEDFNKAIEIEPNYMSAYFFRGAAKAYLKNYNEAIEDWNKVIEIDPTVYGAYGNKGVIKMERDKNKDLKDYFGAISDFSQGIEVRPKELRNYFHRAAVFILLEDYESAISDFTKIISIQPNSGMAYYYRAYSKNMLGDSNEACTDMLEALKISSQNDGWLKNDRYGYDFSWSIYYSRNKISPFKWGFKNECWTGYNGSKYPTTGDTRGNWSMRIEDGEWYTDYEFFGTTAIPTKKRKANYYKIQN